MPERWGAATRAACREQPGVTLAVECAVEWEAQEDVANVVAVCKGGRVAAATHAAELRGQ